MAILTAQKGLVTLSSELSRPDGSMVVANNIIIDSDNTIQQRRGFREYNATEFDSNLKQVISYKNRILAHYENTLSFDSNGLGAFSDFSGDINELVQGFRIKYLEANGNCYFTTANGIKKISVKSADDFPSASITEAGGIKAIDLSGKVVPDSAGFLPPQSKVAYRLVFGTKDANNNVILGSPSARVVLTNNSQDIKKSEIFTVTSLNYAGVTDGQYFYFNTSTQGYLIWYNQSGSGTAPVNADSIDRVLIEVDISTAASNNDFAAMTATTLLDTLGDSISVALNAAEVEVTILETGDVTDANQGNLSPSNILITKTFDGSITTGSSAKTELSFILPDSIDTNYFYQIYRTAVFSLEVGLVLNDIDPGDEHNFVYEAPITSTDISAGEITFEDTTPETFRASGAYLYTNPINGGGIVSANERPPIALDIASFRNSTFYANTKDIHRLSLSVLSVDNFVSGTTKFYIGKGGKSTNYTFVGIVEETQVQTLAKSITVGNSYFTLNGPNDEREYYIWVDKGTLSNSFNSTTAVAADSITINSHGLATNDTIVFSGVAPGGLTNGTTYYAIRINANTIQVSATPNGLAITLTPAVGTATVVHTPIDPDISGKTGIRIPLSLYADTATASGDALVDSLLSIIDFSATNSSGTVTILCADTGAVTNPTESTIPSGWSISVITEGDGEDALAREVLLSVSSSTATSIELTARSLIKVINKDAYSPVFATYLSGSDDLPGKILFESKELDDENFYIAISDSSLSSEFSPELPANIVLDSITEITNVFTTLTAHNLSVGNEIYLQDNPGSTATEFGGKFTVASTPSTTTFTLEGIDVGIDQPGPLSGSVFLASAKSDNNEVPNRIYYSKILQPEAVPISNYIDVGSKDKEILRILALRDNLFIFKEDGIYIVTGQSAPNFSTRLLDNSAILIAPDSACTLNNLIYALTTQGVVSITETGVSIISRGIEDQIKKVTTFAYNFKYNSFGVAYESDRAYLLWLPTTKNDTIATQCFRYNTITNTWTKWTKTNTCGIVKIKDDRLYVGSGIRKYLEQERKNGERQDYADRDFTRSVGANAINNLTITLSSIVDIEVGDVLVQEQYASITKANRLLKMLDNDNGPADDDYYSTLILSTGVNFANFLLSLVSKLNADVNLGTFTTPSGLNTISAIQTDYNLLIDELNDTLSGTVFKSYKKALDLSTYEVVVQAVEPTVNTIDINFSIPLIQGDVQIFKAIKSEVQWSPQHFGMPEKLKQISEGTLVFDQDTIYSGSVSYSSDRSADFEEIKFTLDGPGFWASYPWADTVWGGGSNDRSLRTLIPQNKARCRYLSVKFKHSNARESYKLVGVSLEPREISTRAYR